MPTPSPAARSRRLIADRRVGPVGLGAMPLSVAGRPTRERALATVRAAYEAGVTFIDVADAYCLDATEFGHNESLVAELLREVGADDVLVATKGGHVRDERGGWQLDGRPEYIRGAARASARRLGVEAIGLYQFHRPDPAVAFAESVGALADLVADGTIRMAGVSNVDAAQIGEAREILGDALVSVQNQFSPAFRSSAGELALCAELGLAFLPWSPFGGGKVAKDIGSAVPAFGEVARAHDASPQQVCLAWMLAKSGAIIPIPGASRPQSILDSVAAAHLDLTDGEYTRLDQTVGSTDG